MAILCGWGSIALACTSIVVSRGASRDGSVMVTYSADAPFMPKLLYVPGGTHKAGELIQVRGWEDDRPCGPVKQVANTYSVVGLMNEHQLSLGETTTGGRRELVNRKGMLDYDALMLLTLQRARTAREAIKVVDELAREYGYRSSGETFSIADPNEAWIMELIGKGPDQKGIVWVAARVPDGMITAHANLSRITTFPLDDPENWLYSRDVISFAIEKKFYSTDSQKPFSYRDAYHPGIGAFAEAGLRRPRLEHLPPFRGIPEVLRRLLPRERRGRGLPAVHQARRAAGRVRCDGPDARPLRRHALRHDQGARRRPVRHPVPLPGADLQGGWRGLHVGAADLHPAGGIRHREPEPQGDARRRGRRDLVHARRRLDLVFHPVLLRDHGLAGPVL